jgi:predicted 2-oxoglutarate/Fe(II)-dependent dioxygenase YbiX
MFVGKTPDNPRFHFDTVAGRVVIVSLFLNDDYRGGKLRFPEFGPRTYSAPAGGAVVFSYSLLHEATTVLERKRYVFIPF